MISDLNVPDFVEKDILLAIDILKSAGCNEIYVFGSIAEGSFSDSSDLDLAVTNLDKESYFRIYGQLLSELDLDVDLIVFDYNDDFSKVVEKTGTLKRVA